MDKQDKCNQAQPEPVDASRRELLGKAGKAAWVTPTLVFLSFTAGSANAGGPPDPPSACLPNCPTESTPVNPEGTPTRKPRRD
jgi:hypothetical protein